MNTRRIVSVVSAFGIAAMLLAVPAAPVQAGGPSLDKCQSSIEKEDSKLQGKILKTLQKCADGYRKDFLKGKFGPGTAAKCQGGLDKVLSNSPNPANKDATDKAYAKLSTLVSGGKCDNVMLQSLGHVREDVGDPPDTWVRIALIRALNGAITQEIADTRDFVTIFQQLYDTDDGTSCPSCDQFRSGGPCALHSCALSSGSSTCVNTGTLSLPLTLGGVNTLGVCNSPLLPNDYALIGIASKGLAPVDLGGGTFACVNTLGGEGWISKCLGSAEPTVSTSICQDHIVSAPDSQECPGDCSPDEADTECATTIGNGCTGAGAAHPGVTNGGACLSTTTGPASAGHGFFATTTQITVIFSGQEGTDGIPCTGDDTPAAPGVPSIIPLTTESATADIIDANNTDGAVLPPVVPNSCPSPATATGSLFDCSQIEASNLAGGKLAGAFPALHALFGPPRNDSITTFSLECN